MKKIFLVFVLFFGANLIAQKVNYDQEDVYKKTSTRNLNISFVYPDNWEERNDWPLLVFYHGGGWVGGNIKQFVSYARYFAEKGMVCALVEYRVKKVDGTNPITALMDAKSAMRYLKANGFKYHINPDRVVATGGSAGGHLAAAVELVDDFNDPKDDISIDTKVSALVLFNPVVDNGPNGYGYKRLGEKYKKFSPFHQDKKGMADVLIMVGTKDKHIPVKTMKDFCSDIENAGGVCKLVLYEGAKHGFFNEDRQDGKYFKLTRDEMEAFLRKRNFLTRK